MNKTWVLFCLVAAACASCATSTYRIPGGEMQRLAELNVAQRGALVRVMPHDESSVAFAAVPEPVIVAPAPAVVPATPATPDSDPPAEQSPMNDGELPDRWAIDQSNVDLRIQLDGGNGGDVPASPRAVHPVSSTVHPPLHPPRNVAMRGSLPTRAPAPAVRGAVHGHGGSFGGHWHGGGGGGHGGGGSISGGGNGVALLVAVFLVVGLVVIITETATAEPPPYDGWASISPDHPVHLIYGPGAERVIKMRDLRPDHLVGLRDTIIKDSEGRLRRLPASPMGTGMTTSFAGQRVVADGH